MAGSSLCSPRTLHLALADLHGSSVQLKHQPQRAVRCVAVPVWLKRLLRDHQNPTGQPARLHSGHNQSSSPALPLSRVLLLLENRRMPTHPCNDLTGLVHEVKGLRYHIGTFSRARKVEDSGDAGSFVWSRALLL